MGMQFSVFSIQYSVVRLPFFCKDRPSFVIAPASRNLQIAWRVAFAAEPKTLDELDRSAVARLDVRLETMEFEPREGVCDRLGKARPHQALARERLECVVPEIRTSKNAPDDFRDVHDAHQVLLVPDQECRVCGLRPSTD